MGSELISEQICNAAIRHDKDEVNPLTEFSRVTTAEF